MAFTGVYLNSVSVFFAEQANIIIDECIQELNTGKMLRKPPLSFPILFSMVLAFVPGLNFYSQTFYFGISPGYAFPAASEVISSNLVLSGNRSWQSSLKGSFGTGYIVNIFGGYNLKSISFEVDCSWSHTPTMRTYQRFDTSIFINSSYSGWTLRSAPLIRFDFTERKVMPYFKMGASFRAAGASYADISTFDASIQTSTHYVSKYSGGLSIGVIMCGGIEKKSDRITLFSEVAFVTQRWAPKRSDVIKYEVNGIDNLGSLNTSQAHTHYSQSPPQVVTPSEWKASEKKRQFFPLSSLVISVGARYDFTAKRRDK